MVLKHHAWIAAAIGLMIFWSGARDAAADGCADPQQALGVARVVEIDTTNGPLYGSISLLAREESFLKPGEVVLTFDDGPMPWITSSILASLDQFCTKATFFSVGRMAIAYPGSIREILARGHTLGSHTWSHPLNLKRRSLSRAIDEIERGFAAIALAAGQPIAPFFRFPGLNDSDPLMAHLQSRNIAAFTVDVVSNDSYISDPRRLIDYTLRETDRRNGGIMLFHDIKPATAKALPAILKGLKERGYKVVHMRSKLPIVPLATYDGELRALLAKSRPAGDATAEAPQHLVPFFGEPAVLKTLAGEDVEIAAITAPPRPRGGVSVHPATDVALAPRKTLKTTSLRTKPPVGAKTKRAQSRPAPSPGFSLFGL
jgi:peptidoglycan/xylan/chitin deacetylase (PgdA/CDA1 family)